jgi:hypothetical protein
VFAAPWWTKFGTCFKQFQSRQTSNKQNWQNLLCLSPNTKCLRAWASGCWKCFPLNEHPANRLTINLNQRIGNSEVSQITEMRTAMLSFVNVIGGDGSFAN